MADDNSGFHPPEEKFGGSPTTPNADQRRGTRTLSESMIATVRRLATDPQALAEIERRGF